MFCVNLPSLFLPVVTFDMPIEMRRRLLVGEALMFRFVDLEVLESSFVIDGEQVRTSVRKRGKQFELVVRFKDDELVLGPHFLEKILYAPYRIRDVLDEVHQFVPKALAAPL